MIFQNDKQFNLIPAYLGLRKYILYYNIVFSKSDTFVTQYALMPNACGTLSLAFDGTGVLAELWGASAKPVLLGAEPNRYRILLLVQLSPYGLYQMTRQNQAEFTDKRLLLSEIDSELFRLLHQAFLSSVTVVELVSVCNQILYRRMEQQVVSDALLLADNVICRSHGQVRVNEVARQAGYSERQLNRLFLTQIGMNLKHYMRLTRFNYVLKQLQKPSCPFAILSQQAGYFDQAHFDKDFKAISGVTPQQYLKTMSHFYYEEAEKYHIISSREE